MRSILALLRVNWLTHTSYRLNVVLSLLSLAGVFVPVYFVAGALQPVVADSIADEGAVYLGFLITGILAIQTLGTVMDALPGSVGGGIRSGTFEALFATPTPLRNLLVGMVGYDTLWSMIRGLLLLAGYVAVGGTLAWSGVPLAALIFLLLLVAHFPVGLMAAAMILAFRTAGPLVQGVLLASSLLGGVYYSVSVIPDVVRPLAALLPLTYGLRAFRQTLLAGEPLSVVLPDLAILAAFAVGLMALGVFFFRLALNHARRTGTLAQY